MKKFTWILAALLLLTGCGSTSEPQEGTAGYETLSLEETAGSAFSVGETQQEQTLESETEGLAADEEASLPEEVTLIMAGDILLHTRVEESARQEDGSFDFHPIFANTADKISEADLALVNQEVILGGEELGISGYPAFNGPYEVADALVDSGFDVILHATNHALDKGKRGLLNCLANWKESYPLIPVLGIHDSQESQEEIYVYEQDGIKIAILNYTYGTNGIALPEDMPYAVDMLDADRLAEDIDRAEALADFTIVCPHWGIEYQLEPSAEQEALAKVMLEHGADLVIGTHPHVIQPVEWMTDGESGHEMLIYYSLGNFVNWTGDSFPGIADRMIGGLAEVTIGRNEAGEAVILDYGVTPVIAHLQSGVNGVTVYAFEDYTEALAEANEIVYQDSSFSYQYIEDICDRVWGTLWRKEGDNNGI